MNRVDTHGLKAASYATTLLCWTCGRTHVPDRTRLLCDCGAPLEQQYDIDRMVKDGHKGARFVADGPGIWRYARLLPASGPPVSMQEGLTPLVPLIDTGRRLGIRLLYERRGQEPTCTFNARGASVGVTVGSGGTAWPPYGAHAGLRMRVGLPVTPTPPRIGFIEPPIYGARTTQHGGRTADAFARFRAAPSAEDPYVGGLREPYRLKGEKTVMFEIAPPERSPDGQGSSQLAGKTTL